jgi:acyl-CoA reductase-like NAD-dependent aldehyde dehydrogenase
MTTIDYPQLYIAGTWTAPAGGDTIEVHSPATEELIGSVPRGIEADIDAAVAAARTAIDAADGWATWHPKERADVLERFVRQGPQTPVAQRHRTTPRRRGRPRPRSSRPR